MITLFFMMVILPNHIHWEDFVALNLHILLLQLEIRCSWSSNRMPLYKGRDFSQATQQVTLQSNIFRLWYQYPKGYQSILLEVPSP
jgi:hypothetical protein